MKLQFSEKNWTVLIFQLQGILRGGTAVGLVPPGKVRALAKSLFLVTRH